MATMPLRVAEATVRWRRVRARRWRPSGHLLILALWALSAACPAQNGAWPHSGPPAHSLPRIVLLIDDVGDNLTLGHRATELPAPLNIAILPHTPYAQRLARRAHAQGHEVLLHAPMSNHGAHPLGPGALTPDMDRATLLATLAHNLAAVPHVKGVNNHMGSLLTELDTPMDWLMAELKRRELFFIDSRTTAATVAEQRARHWRVPHLRRHVFLDNERNDKAIARQFEKLLARAREQGLAVGIGHPYPETLDYLHSQLGGLGLRGYRLVSASSQLAPAPKPCQSHWLSAPAHACQSLISLLTPPLPPAAAPTGH